ncbi:MAG TPA: aminopeptidase P N-terminal domain-containing protein [Longimicrobiales bacterium]
MAGSAAACAQRRARVLERLAPHDVLILAANAELLIGRDTHLRYVVDADFYYLTGFTEPDAVLLLDPASDNQFTMFVRARDPERELWHGPRAGVEGVQERFGAHAAHPLNELSERLPRLLAGADTIYARHTTQPQLDGLIQQAFVTGRANRARTGRGPHVQREPGDILDEMRLIKDDDEIDSLRRAARISAESFLATIPRIRPGMAEWEVDALLEYGFRARGASGPAFTTISAVGGNATVLHYVDNNARLNAGDLLLLDAGARYQMYCGDISRTVPVAGRFTDEQRIFYDIVHAAHQAAIAAIRPGEPVEAVHNAARAVLADGLVQSGLLGATERGDETAIKQFFPHRTSHWLGLDVHDVGPYALANGGLTFQPGMVLTVEPGIYLPDKGIGIRIEDDVLVTRDGHEILTAALPSDARQIEALMQ